MGFGRVRRRPCLAPPPGFFCLTPFGVQTAATAPGFSETRDQVQAPAPSIARANALAAAGAGSGSCSHASPAGMTLVLAGLQGRMNFWEGADNYYEYYENLVAPARVGAPDDDDQRFRLM